MGDPIDIPTSNNNSKEPYKDYFLILNNSQAIAPQCENCNNEAIGLFKIVHFNIVNEQNCDFEREEELKNLCESCYQELKSKEQLPSFLEPIYSFLFKENLTIKDLEVLIQRIKETPLNLEGELLAYAKQRGELDEKDDFKKLENLSSKRLANIIVDFLFNYFFGKCERRILFDEYKKEAEDKYHLIVNKHYLIRIRRDLEDIIKHLFPNLISVRFYDEFFNALRDYIITIKKESRLEKINNINCLPCKDMIFDFRTKDECKEEAYFTYQLPYQIRDFVLKVREDYEGVKKGEISYWDFEKKYDDYFKEELFYKVFRKFYNDVNWWRLKLGLGASLRGEYIDDKNRKRGIFIKGEPNTGKTTLMTLLKNTLGNLVRKAQWQDFSPQNEHGLSFLAEGGVRIIWLSEDPHVKEMSAKRFKDLLGEEYIRVRPLYHDSIEIHTKPIVIITVNKIPLFKEYDKAFWIRFAVIETENPIEIDPKLKEKLFSDESREKFLQFLIYCALLYDLNPEIPQDEDELFSLVKEGEDRYYVKEFLEQLPKGSNLQIERKLLYAAYLQWFRENHIGEKEVGRNSFYSIVEKYGYKVKHDLEGNRYFQGIDLPKKDQGSLI